MKGIGIASFLIVTSLTLFYTTIIGRSFSFPNQTERERTTSSLAHALFYLVASFRKIMPWSVCSHAWNTIHCSERLSLEAMKNRTAQEMTSHTSNVWMNQSKISSADEYYHIHMLGINGSKGITDLGAIKIDLLLCLITIFVVMYFCIYRGVKGTGKRSCSQIHFSTPSLHIVIRRQSGVHHGNVTLRCPGHPSRSRSTIGRFTPWHHVFLEAYLREVETHENLVFGRESDLFHAGSWLIRLDNLRLVQHVEEQLLSRCFDCRHRQLCCKFPRGLRGLLSAGPHVLAIEQGNRHVCRPGAQSLVYRVSGDSGHL